MARIEFNVLSSDINEQQLYVTSSTQYIVSSISTCPLSNLPGHYMYTVHTETDQCFFMCLKAFKASKLTAPFANN